MAARRNGIGGIENRNRRRSGEKCNGARESVIQYRKKLEMKAANSKRKHRVSNNSVAAKSHAIIALLSRWRRSSGSR
jgi:hypothetical protein